jgi:hypothetical protein
MRRRAPPEEYADGQLSVLASEAGLSIAPRLLSALALIQESAAFEGDGDLAAAHLLLNGLLRDVEELRERVELALGRPPMGSEQILRALLDGE